MERDRAVSTVVDVGLALLMVTASIGIMVVFLEGEDVTHDPVSAEQTATMLGSTTAPVNYSLEPMVAADRTGAFDDPGDYDTGSIRAVAHRPTAGLIGDVAVAKTQFDYPGDPKYLTLAYRDYERSVDGATRDVLTGPSNETQIVATWKPYDGATVVGKTRIGPSPPADADVHVATMTVPATTRTARETAIDEVRSAPSGEKMHALANVVAHAMVDGHFPPAQTQRALEGSGMERDRTVNKYLRFAELLEVNGSSGTPDPDEDDWRYDYDDGDHSGDDGDPDPYDFNDDYDDADEFHEWLERQESDTPDAQDANEYVIVHLTDYLREDLEATYSDPETAAQAVTTGQVTLTVRTWNTETYEQR